MGSDAIARDFANHAAGGTLNDLRAREATARKAVDLWITTYAAALSDPKNQLAITPPLTVREAAEALAISQTTLRELIRLGRIKKVGGIGDVVRISKGEIQRLLDD